ncbi:MAG: Spy/CpxP family protein refolding chaperone [Myxococcota bacterium]
MTNSSLLIPLSLGLALGPALGCAEVSEEDLAAGAPEELLVSQPPTEGGEFDRRFARIQERLGLSEEQAVEVRPILERAHEERRALRDLPRPERREAARALREQTRTELTSILSAEQLEAFDTRRGRRGRHGRHGHGGLRALGAELDLTDEQRTAFEQVVERWRASRQEQPDLSREERRSAREARLAEARAELEPVLSAEQLARFDAFFDPETRHLRRMTRALSLSEEQAEAVAPIVARLHERRQALRDLPRQERRAAREALRTDLRAELAPLLDEGQLARFDELGTRRGRGHRMRHRQ